MTSQTFKLFGLIAFILVIQSCSHDKPGYWINNQIDPGKKADLHQLNDQVFKDLKADDLQHIHTLMSKELIDDSYTLRQVQHISSQLNRNDFTIFNEYYVINQWKDADTINSGYHGVNNYILLYKGIAREMYIILFLPKKGDDKSMITAVYAKYDYGWKLAQLDLGTYSINGKTAPELYKLVKEKLQKNYLSDAVTTMSLAFNCIEPSMVCRYPDDSLIRLYYRQLIDKGNEEFKFPVIIKGVPTHPSIFRIFNEKIPEGTFPMIDYMTSVNIKDTAAIKKENAAIKKVIGTLIPGIDKDKKYLLYGAYNQKPNIKTSVDHFDITDKLQ